MKRPTASSDKVLTLARRMGVLRIRDLTPHGIHPEYVRRLCKRGVLVRTGRGLYVPADASVTSHHTLAEACKRVPKGVVCLLSALMFHGLTTQSPSEVWLAIEGKARKPKADRLKLRVMRFSGEALTTDVQVRRIEGVPVRVYSPAKTVVDCFKYRHKLGLDVAIEALRDCRRQHKCTNDELWRTPRSAASLT